MAKWTKITSAPNSANKYFVTINGGGYNRCILGNASTNKEKNRQTPYSVLPNCVGYVYGVSLMASGKTSLNLPTCNAKDWYKTLNWKKTQTPTVGAIACWDGEYGHVAIVNEVYSDGSFQVAESGWTSFYWRLNKIGANKFYANSLKFQGFLINPYVDKEEAKKSTTSSFLPSKGYWGYGDKDDRVGQIASFMYKMFPSYTKKAALGNWFGPNLKASIVEFQKRTGLESDGNVGPITLAKLQSFGFKY